MADKFGMNYVLTIDSNLGNGQQITVAPPFTLEFDVNRNVLGSLNVGTFRVMGLGKQNRNAILKDFFDYSTTRKVILQAGYGTNVANLPTIFYGTIFQAFSVRRDNWVTEIVGQSGGFAVPKVYWNGSPFAKGTSDQVVIQALVNYLAQQGKLNVGFIGKFPNVSSRGRAYDKPVYDLLQELSGNGVFIDNSKINVMNQGESIPTPNPVIVDSAMGLLGTPIREQNNMTIPIIFSPEIDPGRIINLQASTIEDVTSTSTTFQNYNGLQRVNSVRHKGTISGAVSSETTTEIGVTFGIPAVKGAA